MLKDNIKIGIIGCNYWGRNILRSLIENSGCCSSFYIVGCSDESYPSNLHIINQRYPYLNTTLKTSELIESPDVDALVIATDISMHYDIAKRAILNGKHLLIDKLIASTSDEAAELVELSHVKQKVLMVASPLEYAPPGVKIKEIINKRKLGKIYYITSSRLNLGMYRPDINVVWDLACHDVSLQIWWLNELPVCIWASGRESAYRGIYDTAFISMEYPSGTLTNIEVSWLSPVKLRQMVIAGSRKMLVFDDTESTKEKIKIYDKGADLRDPENFDEFQLSYRSGDVVSPKLDIYEPLGKVVAEFFECLDNNYKKPMTNGEKGIQVIKILEAIERSLRKDGHMEKVDNILHLEPNVSLKS